MRHKLLALTFVFAIASCGAKNSSSTLAARRSPTPTFDVNDVSILWPLPEKREDLPQLISLDGTGLLSADNFMKLLDITKFEDDPGYEYWRIKYWYIVGARFDPCAKVLPTDAGCDIELRLVAQPMMHFSDSVLAADNALHLIYRLNPEQGETFATTLLKLKVENGDTTGKPLNIHPIMATQGLSGAFAKGMKELVLEFAREENIKEATAMLRLNATDWRFARSFPDASGVLKFAAIPFVDGPQQTLFGDRRENPAPGIFNEIRPAATAADSLNEAVDSDEVEAGTFYKLPKVKQDELMQAALRIDNPLAHTPSTIDCVSCHMASRVLTRVKGRRYIDNNDGNVDRYVAAASLSTANVTKEKELALGYTVRAFGYGLIDARGPAISQRTINDSARVADYLNTSYLPHF